MDVHDAPEITVRKRRDTAGEQDPVKATADWLDNLLRQTTSEGKRVMSPATEANVRGLLQIYQQASSSPPENYADLVQPETLTTIRREIDRRLASDAKYAEARWKLEQLERDAWFLRYGDYHATTLSALRAEARRIRKEAKAEAKRAKKQEAKRAARAVREVSPNTKTETVEDDTSAAASASAISPHEDRTLVNFLSQPWITIDDTLRKEELAVASRVPPETPSTPMTDLITKVVDSLPNTFYRDMRSSITLYAQRYTMAHGQVGMLASSRKFLELATKLNTDLLDLMRKGDISTDVREATRVAIFATIPLYFKEFERDEISGDVLSFKAWPMVDGRFVRTQLKVHDEADVEAALESIDTMLGKTDQV